MANLDPRLNQVLQRSAAADAGFVYAVNTTGIYCRPGCPSRHPKPQNIRFFDTGAAARAAGFRACRRCRPDELPADPQARAVMAACRAIDAHLEAGEEGPPRLADLAAAAGLSRFHFQRLFTALLGLPPRVFADARRVARLKQGLRSGIGVAQAGYDAGFGSSSRVYEQAAARLGMTPATYAKGGAGAALRYSTCASPLGHVLVAATQSGIAAVYLGDDVTALLRDLKAEFPAATITAADGLQDWLAEIVARLGGATPSTRLPLDVRATAFQQRVWAALAAIPPGETRTYAQIAAGLGVPRGQRAVGRACATNPVAVIVPCHRAVRGDGGLGGYRWGLERKRRLLAAEKGE
jgi:AraC family transcriptional regulator of adaptative response/methylated-DNA-[protein]-cysteine methyltransferase